MFILKLKIFLNHKFYNNRSIFVKFCPYWNHHFEFFVLNLRFE